MENVSQPTSAGGELQPMFGFQGLAATRRCRPDWVWQLHILQRWQTSIRQPIRLIQMMTPDVMMTWNDKFQTNISILAFPRTFLKARICRNSEEADFRNRDLKMF